MKINAEFPPALQEIFNPYRYKVLYGGRGGGKSWNVARALLILGAQKKLRILCGRELQNSIKDSVHKLLKDQIEALGIQSLYTSTNTTITGINGTEFIFEGLKHNISSIKSIEGVDIVWVEEAQTVSKLTWETLVPTIRKDDSEIWVTFNPELEEDETYDRFITNHATDSLVIKIGWQDNAWFNKILDQERKDLKVRDAKAYLNVWEGECRSNIEGAVFAQELEGAKPRIISVPYDPTKLVHTFWDLGWSDTNAIWFIQKIANEYHIIDYYESKFDMITDDIATLQSKNYVYGTDYIPHDSKKTSKQTGMSIKDQMVRMGRKVEITPKLGKYKKDGIDAARRIFPMCKFDELKTKDGVNGLRHYKYKVDEDDGSMSKAPIHDWASHASDAFMYFALSSLKVKGEMRKRQNRSRPRRGYQARR